MHDPGPRRTEAKPKRRAGGSRETAAGPASLVADWEEAVDGSLSTLRQRLRRWHDVHGRDLPWRNAGDAYRVWISEIMLQQTTVAAVRPYFERFLTAFPTVADLAAAAETDVLRQWEGLGYYSRGRNLHRAAQAIVANHGGRLPEAVAELQSLPGIGRYTASAIASFAFDQRAPIVEANTLRLYSRLLGYEGDPRSAAGQKLLWEFADQLVPAKSPGAFNQALMDLGALVCTPRDPGCDQCPLQRCCLAFRAGKQHEIPVAQSRPETTDLLEAAVILERKGKYLVRPCAAGERWAGLWDFPRVGLTSAPLDGLPPNRQIDGPLPPALSRELRQKVKSLTGIEVETNGCWMELKHTVTRYRIRLLCLRGTPVGGRLAAAAEWLALADLRGRPLSTTGRIIVNRLSGE